MYQSIRLTEIVLKNRTKYWKRWTTSVEQLYLSKECKTENRYTYSLITFQLFDCMFWYFNSYNCESIIIIICMVWKRTKTEVQREKATCRIHYQVIGPEWFPFLCPHLPPVLSLVVVCVHPEPLLKHTVLLCMLPNSLLDLKLLVNNIEFTKDLEGRAKRKLFFF